jgi:hypothetical protein
MVMVIIILIRLMKVRMPMLTTIVMPNLMLMKIVHHHRDHRHLQVHLNVVLMMVVDYRFAKLVENSVHHVWLMEKSVRSMDVARDLRVVSV